MRDLTIRPIDAWPDGWDTEKERKPNPFKTRSYEATLETLDYELDRLHADAAHLQLDVVSGDVRRDGHLRANAKVGHPGVILTIDSRHHGVLTYPCDTFAGRWYGDPPDWQINLRAIALGLEALRKVERYGIAERGQQYAGFKALGAGGPTALSAAMTVDEACRLLATYGGPWNDPEDPPEEHVVGVAARLLDPDTAGAVAGLYRNASKRHHPDVGGDPALFRRLTEARDLLVAHSG